MKRAIASAAITSTARSDCKRQQTVAATKRLLVTAV
jgi:hypothetical protein